MLVQKCKGRRKRDNSKTNPAIHGKELFEKGGAFFSLSKFFENRIEYMFGLLYGIDLMLRMWELIKNEKLSVH